MNKELNRLSSLAKNNNLKLLPVMENLTKEQVAVKVTKKNRKHIKNTAKIFGYKLGTDETLFLGNIYVDSPYFLGTSSIKDRALISHKQLRTILAKEHLKVGDLIFTKYGELRFWNQTESNPNYFKRYATPEEIELLEGKKEKELEVGKWYKSKRVNALFYLTEIKEKYRENKGFGIIKSNEWYDNRGTSFYMGKAYEVDFFTEATPQEVQQALSNEAIKRGHKYDVYSWNHEQNTLYGNRGNDAGHDILFENGVWSEVKEQDKFAELKEAHKNGAVIQWRREIDGRCVWKDCHENDPPAWRHFNEYRIKPEEKPKVGDLIKYWDVTESRFSITFFEEGDEDFFSNYKHEVVTKEQVKDLLLNDKN